MVASVISYHHTLQAVCLCNAARYRQHDTVAERHHRRFHVSIVIRALGNGVGAIEQRRMEILVHEAQRNDEVRYLHALTMKFCKGYLVLCVVTAVVECHGHCYLLAVFVEHRDGIHSARKDDY